MPSKNKQYGRDAWKNLVIIVVITMNGAAMDRASDEFTTFGPEGYPEWFACVETAYAEPSDNDSMMEEIQQELNKFKLNDGIEKMRKVMDCSNLAEIDWYILTKEGYNCDIMGNIGFSKSTRQTESHAYLWVYDGERIIIVEPTAGEIGRVITDVDKHRDAYYLVGRRIGSPEDVKRLWPVGEVIGVNEDTPIEELPIHEINTTGPTH